MKLLILLLAVLGGVWLWKRGRRLEQSKQAPPKSSRREVQPMLSCAVCGVHVPQTDAVKGQRGSYCSVAHRRQAEG